MQPTDNSVNYPKYIDLNANTFSFTRFTDLSPIEIERLAHAGLIYL